MSEYKTDPNTGDTIGPMGWGEGHLVETERFDSEQRRYDEVTSDYPAAFCQRPARDLSPAMLLRITEIHAEHGLEFPRDVDLRLVSLLFEDKLAQWPAQRIGSCVASGGMRAWTLRAWWEVALGQPEELLGGEIMGKDTVAHYAPVSYGLGRRRGNMRRGDGAYCSVQVESYMKDGVLDCSTPQLHSIAGSDDSDYPEPRSESLYRDFGSWKHLNDLLPYCDHRLLESVKVKDTQGAVDALAAFKPMMICSSWGFAPRTQHSDGFWIYKKSGSWAHNMTIAGMRTAGSDTYIMVLNSWGPRAHRDGEVLWIPADLFGSWVRNASCLTIGEIDLPDSRPGSIF